MNLLVIQTNKGKMIDNGFRHTVYQSGKMNGKNTLEKVASCKFNDILESGYITEFTKDPNAFMKSLEE